MELKDTKNRLTYHAGLLSILTGISRVLGLFREIIIAYFFGAGSATDAFFVAFRLPNLLRRLFAEGAITISFIPVFARYLHKHGEEEAKKFANSIFTVLTVVLFLITVTGIVFASLFVLITAPGFYKDPDKFDLTVNLTRIMFPFIFSIGLVSLFSGILNTYNHFFTPALAPIFLNISVIAGAFIFYSSFTNPVYSLAIGVLIGSIAQLVVQIPPLLKRGYRFRLVTSRIHPGVKETGRLFFPATFGAAVYQINLVVTTFLASFLTEGSVAFLWYAGRFFELPLGVFAISIAVVSLPNLSYLASNEKMEEWKKSLNYGLALTFFITIPATAGLMIFSEQLIKIFYEFGKFTSSDTSNTSSALFYYASGLWAVGGSRVVVQAYYSLKDTKTPVKIATFTFLINLLLSVILMVPMKHSGLALATTLASVANFVLLLIFLRKKVGRLGIKSLMNGVAKTMMGTIIMCSVLYYLLRMVNFKLYSKIESTGVILALTMIGIFVFGIVEYLLKSNELMVIVDTYWRRKKKF